MNEKEIKDLQAKNIKLANAGCGMMGMGCCGVPLIIGGIAIVLGIIFSLFK